MLKWTFKPRRASSMVSLTSLMDVMTILLVYILINYRDQPLGDLPSNASLPIVSNASTTVADSDLGESLNVIVTEMEMRIGETRLPMSAPPDVFGAAFREALVAERHRGGKTRGQLMVQADARVPYRTIDRIVRAASYLGITRIRFVALTGPEGRP